MAMAMANLPFPLLLDSFLANSWTWLALSLATIATLLRALRVPFSRHPLSTREASQPTLAADSVESESAPRKTEQSPFSRSLQKTHKRRTRSKSTSALEKLLQNQEGFRCSGLGLLSCLLDAETSPGFRKVSSASKIFNGQSECGRRESANHRPGFRPDAIEQKLGLGLDEVGLGLGLGLGSGSGFIADTQKGENEGPSYGSIREQLSSEEDLSSHHLLPSWAFFSCESVQNSLISPSLLSHCVDKSSPSKVPPCFEEQFGWDRLLETRLGSPWQCHVGSVLGLTKCKGPIIQSQHIVKIWSGQQKNLLATLKIEESSTLALDEGAEYGLTCVGNEKGGISLWDVEYKACVSVISSDVRPVSALSTNSDKGVTIAGNGHVLGLWDQRTPIYMPILDWNKPSNDQTPFVALQSKGNELCIAKYGGVLSMCDLRNMHGESVSTVLLPRMSGFLSKTEEVANKLWEKLACDVEEEFWDESNENAVEKSSSFISRCAVFVRSLSASAPQAW